MGKAIVVLAQGRTGTTIIAKILNALGVFMGHQLSKNHEDRAVYNIHQAMIGDWRNPNINPTPDTLKRYATLIATRKTHTVWGIKDPRLCFLFKYLEPHIQGESVRVIRTYRPRDSVIASLSRWPGLNQTEAVRIYELYHSALQETLSTNRYPTLVVPYNALVDHPRAKIAQIATFIGLPFKEEAVQLVDSNRRHW